MAGRTVGGSVARDTGVVDPFQSNCSHDKDSKKNQKLATVSVSILLVCQNR